MFLPVCVQAQTTPLDVPYFKAHPQQLEATLKLCHTNVVYANTPTCFNAESAGAGRMAQDWGRAARTGSSSLYDPSWWSANKFTRAGILLQCRRRGPNDWLAYPYCQAAQQSALMDP
jgi:hypothetical protein